MFVLAPSIVITQCTVLAETLPSTCMPERWNLMRVTVPERFRLVYLKS